MIRSDHSTQKHSNSFRRGISGFSLVELLVAVTILVFVLGLVFSVITQTSTVWRRSSDKIESFQEARLAFESITRNLSQATLNTFLDYDDPTNPTRYLRKAELKFLSGQAGTAGLPGIAGAGQAFFFQAPLGYAVDAKYKGMDTLLNTCGYYVDFGSNAGVPSHVAAAGKNPHRCRLMQLIVPAEMKNSVYQFSGQGWFTSFLSRARPVADNVIALILQPTDPSASNSESPNNTYAYDSTAGATLQPQPVTANQLPPMMQVTMVAIDETSALRLEEGTSLPGKIRTALDGKFATRSSFDRDISDLKDALQAEGINYRVFSGAVPLRESKWTK